ncbi:hypothetical protein EJ05DRAFT_472709 [Pseudovirgaria hyperparasitica]|uniref:Uncharacterized protein n=1 Tax=Pseudovirgaria hyperparasitica TaxID=470096 RepID=A0A6A6WI64_9PEZI|nr:uncharacterized protein EJ05DRAFT_472709 [Pseudovirgaria hyperparasitica]KAF2761740.1 hypothetical protein EJ05DRAFT_472709 [Pseudovirgaria hyperparasitica]
MGNCCGSQSKDAFTGEGRTLGSAPPPKPKASIPAAATTAPKPTTKGAGRATGGSAGGLEAGDPRGAAAAAAEARANKASGSGPLAQKLQEQKKQTRTATLEQVSRENRQARDADAVADARHYN